MFLIQQNAANLDVETNDSEAESGTLSDGEIQDLTRTAIWTVSISLATIMLSLFGMALLNQPRDARKSLRVNNRYLRLVGRPIYAVIILAIAGDKDIGPETFMGTCSLLMLCVSMWEYATSLEKGGGFVEPKKATA